MGASIGVRAPDRRSIDLGPLELLLPVLVAVSLLFFLLFLLQGIGVVSSFSETYEPSGQFAVEECSAPKGRIGTRVTCSGELTPDDGVPVESELVGPIAAFGSAAPSGGQTVDVYYEAGNTDRSFPSDGRSTEFARVLASLVPLILIVGGLVCWLAGWLLTRGADASDPERNADRYTWPARFSLRPRGAAWTLFGLAWWLIDRVVIGGVLGSAGLG